MVCAGIVEVHLLFALVTCMDDGTGELLNLMFVGIVHIQQTQCQADAVHSGIVLGLGRVRRTGMVEVHLLFDVVPATNDAGELLLDLMHVHDVVI